MDSEPEKRKRQRARASVAAQCWLIDFPTVVGDEKPMFVARLCDISTSGMRLDVPGRLPVGTRVRILFTSDTGKAATLHCEVVRIEENRRPTALLTSHGLKMIKEH